MDEPATALQAAENALRLAIRQVLGDGWKTDVDVERLTAKRDEDARRRDGAIISDDLLAYTELYELREIVLKRWERFKPVFNDKKRMEVWLAALEDVRNAIAHSRQLLEHERYLVTGVSGQIRNLVTLYRTRENPPTAHYAIIERVQDELGGVGLTEWERMERNTHPITVRLDVGDVVTVECSGSYGRGRELEWIVRCRQFNTHIPGAVITRGETVTLDVPITEEHIGEWLSIHVYVRPANARYTLHNSPTREDHNGPLYNTAYDDTRQLDYAVNPPAD